MSLQRMKKSAMGGSYWRKHFAIDGVRTCIRLGRLSEKNAAEVDRQINVLLECRKHGTDLPAATNEWLRRANAELVVKLSKYELCVAMVDPTVLEFVKRFREIKNVAPRTQYQFESIERHLREFFGETKRLKDVSPTDADNLYQWLLKRYNVNSANRKIGRCREIFNEAIEQSLIVKNSFKKKTISVSVGARKKQEVTEETIRQVIDHCPSTEWKLLFAMARWIGCRIPSEIQNLAWEHLDWERNAILIQSPKTACKGKPERLVPIFPEIADLLSKQFEEAEEGELFVFPSLRNGKALSTTAKKIVRRAKLAVWGSFWNTLRANRETDLMDSHGIRKACAWIGNTPAVAMKNYRIQKGGDFDDGDRFQQQGLPRTSKRTTHGPEQQRIEENGSNENAEKSGTWEHGGAPQSNPDSRDRNRTCTPCGTRS
jgi:integrase